MNWRNWTGSATFWRTLPNSSLIIFLAAVFCLFGSFGFILDTSNLQETTASELALNVVLRSCFGVCWAFLGIRRMFKSMVPLAVVQVLSLWLLHSVYSSMPTLANDAAALSNKLKLDTAGTMICVIGGYVLFLVFFQREGRRFFAAHTEIRLAGEIHRSLVPELSFKTREFEFFGASFPSGAVGGDLVDVIQDNGRWFAYVADVSGHGVPAGVIMSMTKSAVRMWLASHARDSALFCDMNDVLKPLLTSNMFVTFAYAAWNSGPDLAFSSAGHVPLLHYRASGGSIEQRSVPNLPLGILPDQHFTSSTLRFECGDALAIVSDGFTETVDSKGRELGLAAIAKIVENGRDTDLKQISAELREQVRKYGQQEDDQTILLVRRLPIPVPANSMRLAGG
jgi:Stage II sporulation protein E (SpoIIE)